MSPVRRGRCLCRFFRKACPCDFTHKRLCGCSPIAGSTEDYKAATDLYKVRGNKFRKSLRRIGRKVREILVVRTTYVDVRNFIVLSSKSRVNRIGSCGCGGGPSATTSDQCLRQDPFR